MNPSQISQMNFIYNAGDSPGKMRSSPPRCRAVTWRIAMGASSWGYEGVVGRVSIATASGHAPPLSLRLLVRDRQVVLEQLHAVVARAWGAQARTQLKEFRLSKASLAHSTQHTEKKTGRCLPEAALRSLAAPASARGGLRSERRNCLIKSF